MKCPDKSDLGEEGLDWLTVLRLWSTVVEESLQRGREAAGPMGPTDKRQREREMHVLSSFLLLNIFIDS